MSPKKRTVPATGLLSLVRTSENAAAVDVWSIASLNTAYASPLAGTFVAPSVGPTDVIDGFAQPGSALQTSSRPPVRTSPDRDGSASTLLRMSALSAVAVM